MKKIILCLFVILFAASCSNNDDNLTELGDDGTCLMNTDWNSGTCMYSFIKKNNGTKELDIMPVASSQPTVFAIDKIIKKDGFYYIHAVNYVYVLDSMGCRVKHVMSEYDIKLDYHETYIEMYIGTDFIHAGRYKIGF